MHCTTVRVSHRWTCDDSLQTATHCNTLQHTATLATHWVRHNDGPVQRHSTSVELYVLACIFLSLSRKRHSTRNWIRYIVSVISFCVLFSKGAVGACTCVHVCERERLGQRARVHECVLLCLCHSDLCVRACAAMCISHWSYLQSISLYVSPLLSLSDTCPPTCMHTHAFKHTHTQAGARAHTGRFLHMKPYNTTLQCTWTTFRMR